MAMRTISSPAQRVAIFDPPDEALAVERLYTLGPEDLAETVRRRRAPNRLGFAVQLSYLRHPGRALEPGEVPSPALLQVLSHQLGCEPAAFTEYAGRETTLRSTGRRSKRGWGCAALNGAIAPPCWRSLWTPPPRPTAAR